MGSRLAMVALLVSCGGCTEMLPPPATPEPVVPDVGPLPPSPKETGRVIVDVVDGPTQVHRLSTQSVVVGMDKDRPITATTGETTEALCVSPCVVDLPPGRHTLAFPTPGGDGLLELGDVDVRAQPTVYRRDLGSYRRSSAGLPLGIVGVAFGGMAVVTGLTLLPVGLATDLDGMAIAGGITLGAGSLLTVLGVLGILDGRAAVQPGTGVQYPLPQ